MSSSQSNSKLTKNRKRLAKFMGVEFKPDAKLVAELGIKNKALSEQISTLTANNDVSKFKEKNELLQKTCDEQQDLIRKLEKENDVLTNENEIMYGGNVPPKRANSGATDREIRKENNRLRSERNDFRESAESWEKYYDTKTRELERTKSDLEVCEKKNKSVIGTMNQATNTREIYEYHYLRMSEHICRLLSVVEEGRADLFDNTGLKIFSMGGGEPMEELTADMFHRRRIILKKHAKLNSSKLSSKADADASTSSSKSSSTAELNSK